MFPWQYSSDIQPRLSVRGSLRGSLLAHRQLSWAIVASILCCSCDPAVVPLALFEQTWVTTVPGTLHPNLEIDGRPISRLLSILTTLKSSASSSVCPVLPSLPATPAAWQISSSFILGVTKLSWARAGLGLGQSRPEKWLAPCSGGPRRGSNICWDPRLTGIWSSMGRETDETDTHTHTEETLIMLFSCLVSS